jgi:hypothetical protein
MSDLALKASGLACALGSVWFAVHMFNHQESGPRVNAMEDFAIFAQPNRTRAVEAAVRAAVGNSETRKTAEAISIDMTPIGATTARAPRKPEPERRDVRILELNDDSALLETRDGYRRIRVGDESPEVGKIISIRKMADYWIVVASERSIAQRAPVAYDPNDGEAAPRP